MLHDVILRNVRTPDYIAGDLAAQVSSARAGGEELNELCDRYGLDHIEDLSDAIIERSETAMREGHPGLSGRIVDRREQDRRERRLRHCSAGPGDHRP